MFKFYFHLLFLTTVFLLCFFSCSFFDVTFSFSYFFLSNINNFFFVFSFDFIFFVFATMVLSVTSMVISFSEVYMKTYFNMKFVFLMFLFFFSMIFLICSAGIFNLMTGWDFLGLTSIFLIMFYMNKQTQINSILTMGFNRAGDIFLALTVFMFFDSGCIFFFQQTVLSCWVYYILFCSFTKSAQFPFSSWLPAAMSAPTPISAMVHSSTLVTAGVFLILKFKDYLTSDSCMVIFEGICLLGFLIGAFMANFETDFKKLVAYSTLSQISMIFFFVLFFSGFLGLIHMFFHAFFKSFLFSMAGYIFMVSYSIQSFSLLGDYKNKILHSCLFVCIYCMSGLFYSSSFYTKDFCLEYLLSSDFFSFFIIFFLGSILSISYGSNILKVMEPSFSFSSVKSNNYIISIILLLFFLLNLVIHNSSFLFVMDFALIGAVDLYFISSVMIFFLFVKFWPNNLLMGMIFNVGGMKLISFDLLKSFYLKFFKNVTKDDFFFFFYSNNFTLNFSKSNLILVFLFFFLLIT